MSEQLTPKPKLFIDLKKSIKNISPTNLASLLAYVELFDVLFVFVLIFAILKDLADMFISLIPLIGFVLSLFISVFCAIFIFLIMFFLGAGANKKLAKRLVIIFVGTLVDTVPLISFFPIETAVVIITFFMILKERKEKAEENKQKESKKQEKTQQAYA